MELVVLGSGGSWPCRERNVPAFALRIDGSIVLLDCGEGTQRQFMQSPLSFMQVKHILISHFHGDHFLGLPGLLQTMALNDRKDPLTIHGPEGTAALVEELLRIGNRLPNFPPFEVKSVELRDGDNAVLGGCTVTARTTVHPVPCLAYAVQEPPRPGRFSRARADELGIPPGPLFRELQHGRPVEHDGVRIEPESVVGPPRRGRRVVYTGDTAPSRAVEELAKGADLLVHDSTAASDLQEKANSYGHSTARQAAGIASAAGVGRLLLAHISPRYKDPSPLLAEAQAVFPNSLLASDLLAVDIPLPEEG